MLTKVFVFTALVAVACAADCTISDFSKVADAVKSCTALVIKDMEVPGGETLELALQKGASLTFEGHIKFGYYNWAGPLLRVIGEAISVKGAKGHVLDPQGPLYWDGKGSSGVKKPKFFKIEATGGSEFLDINIKNCAVHCMSIGNSDHLTLDGWTVDVSEGDVIGSNKKPLGHNTDGFDISSSSYVLIQNTKVYNQDDCIAVNQGHHMTFYNMYCSGGHGLSLSVGQSKENGEPNTVSDINFLDSTVIDSDNGIHIKTHTDAGTGAVNDVTYRNIKFDNLAKFGINVQEDYKGGSSSGKPTNNIPIKNLVFDNIHGIVQHNGENVKILCASGGCIDWKWSNIDITGGKKNECNFEPVGYSC